MRYLVAEGAVGPNGRQVKCAHCGHQWFQEGEEGLDEALFDVEDAAFSQSSQAPGQEQAAESASFPDAGYKDADDFQSILQKEMGSAPAPEKSKRNIPDIPEGVRPAPDGQGDLVIPAKRGFKWPAIDARFGGFATAGLIFLAVICALLLTQPQISRAWPPSNMIYALIGLTPAAPGEGLALANLQAKFENGHVTLSGDINNLKPEAIDVPAILASFTGAGDAVMEQVLIPPPIDRIKGEGHVSFSVVHTDVPADAKNVTFAFTYMKADKTEESVSKHQDSHAEEIEKGQGESSSNAERP